MERSDVKVGCKGRIYPFFSTEEQLAEQTFDFDFASRNFNEISNLGPNLGLQGHFS